MCACTTLGPLISQEELLEKLLLNQNKIHSFRGVAHVDFQLSGQKGSMEAVVIAEKEGDIRVETGNFFGVPLSVLTISKDKLMYYVMSEEKIYIGKASQMAQDILPLHITDQELLGLLLFSRSTVEKFMKHARLKVDFFSLVFQKDQKIYYPEAIKLTNTARDEYLEIRWEAYDINPSQLSKEHFSIDIPSQVRVYSWSRKKGMPLLQGYDTEK